MNIYFGKSHNNKYLNEQKTGMIPSQMSVELDSFIDGHYQRNSLQVNIIQNNIDTIIKELFSSIDNVKFKLEQDQPKNKKTNETGFLSNAAEQINTLFRKLNIKDRNENENKNDRNQPQTNAYAFITLRNNDVDVIVIPVTAEDILYILKAKSFAESLQKIKSTFAHVVRRFTGASNIDGFMQLLAAVALNQKNIRIPTSLGMPLKVSHSSLLFGIISMKNEEKIKNSETLAFHPNVNYVEHNYMRVWMAPLAGISSGMTFYRAFEFNLPLEVEIKNLITDNSQSQTIVQFRLCQYKVRVFGFYNSQFVYVSRQSTQELESNKKDNRVLFKTLFDSIDASTSAKIIETPIQNEELNLQQREIDLVIMKNEKISFPFRIHGYYNMPYELSIAEILKITKYTKNTIHIDFAPVQDETPLEIKLTIDTNIYQSLINKDRKEKNTESQPWSSIRTRIEDFYSKFENTFFKQNNAKKFLNSEESSEQQMSKKIEENMYMKDLKLVHQYLEQNADKSISYKHSMKMSLETVGGRRQLKANAEIYAICDANFHACESRVVVTRSPILNNESQPWSLNFELQSVYPEQVYNAQELKSFTNFQKQHLKLFGNLQAQWGIPTKLKTIRLNILGEPTEEMIRKFLNTNVKYQQRLRNAEQRDEPEIRIRQIQNKSPLSLFINQFNIVAEYQLSSDEESYVQRIIETIKTKYFWNTKSELINNTSYAPSKMQLLKATIRFDPNTRRHANVSLETSSQRIFIQSLEMPIFFSPFDLVTSRREHMARMHSSPNPLSRMVNKIVELSYGKQQLEEQNLRECIVGRKTDYTEQNTIFTFDGVVYNAPISKCYSVLAKDCTKVNRQPKYAVLIKQFGKKNQKVINLLIYSIWYF